jgi:hypothetical protein
VPFSFTGCCYITVANVIALVVLFAVGLTIFLWDIHLAVAIPVLIVALTAVAIYVACTILPFIDSYCPYSTTLFRMYKRLRGIDPQAPSDDTKQDEVTSQALCWMITSCETPRSIDVALQSIAAASEDLPLDKLEKCTAWSLVGERFLTGSSHDSQPDAATLLYSRALLAWGAQRDREVDPTYRPASQTGRLDAMIWALQSRIDRYDFSRESDFLHSDHPLLQLVSSTDDFTKLSDT